MCVWSSVSVCPWTGARGPQQAGHQLAWLLYRPHQLHGCCKSNSLSVYSSLLNSLCLPAFCCVKVDSTHSTWGFWLPLLRGHCSLSPSSLDYPLGLLFIMSLLTACSVRMTTFLCCWPRHSHTLWWQTGRLDTQQFSQLEWLSKTPSKASMTIFIICSQCDCQ